MRKILLALFIGFICFIQQGQSQVTVTMSGSTVNPGAQASVDVTVNGFTNVLGAQFSINYDSTVLSFLNVGNFTTALPGLNSGAVSGPNGVGVQNGQITFSWFDQQGTGKTLPNGTRLFTINFTAIGAACTSSAINISNMPLAIEFVNSNFNTLNVTGAPGTVSVRCDGPVDPCPDPACTNPSNLTFTGAKRDATPGTNVCIPITFTNFNGLQSGQGLLTWNPSLISFTEAKNFGLPGLESSLNLNNTGSGQLTYVWSNPNPATPLTLPNNTIMMELCFNVTGPVGQVACILMGQGNPPTEWTNDNGEVPVCFSYGKVTIKDSSPRPPVVIKASTVQGNKDSVVCVDIRVDSFTNIVGMQFRLNWDPAVLQYVSTGMYDLEGLTASAFTNTASQLIIQWLSPNSQPVSKAANHKIFNVCFRLIGACDATSAITFTNPIEVVGLPGPEAVPHQTVPGAVTINCSVTPPVCTVTGSTNPSCNGATDGSINLTVTNADPNCDCIWKRADGTIIKNNKVTAGCNLPNVGAGTYTFELICNGTLACSSTTTLTQPDVLTIPTGGAVTNASCGAKGSINVTPTGGTPPYTYNWNPAQGNTNNPTGLDPGVYMLTVTDSRSCTSTASFTVGNTVTELTATISHTNVSCRGGNNGTISLSVSGGCTPYTFAWTGPLTGQNPQNVSAGAYSVTISDSSTPAMTRILNVTVTEPETAVSVQVTAVVRDMPPGSNTGSITILASGGTPNYTTQWSGSPTTIPSGNTSGMLTAGNLGAGTYNVTVTDQNGCTAVQNSIIVMAGDTVITPKAPRINTVGVATNFNGFNVPCNGNCNAVITATLNEGDTPITAVLRRGTSNVQTLTINALSEVRFTGVCAGTYTIQFNNSVGTVTSSAITVTQPSRLAATQEIKCSDGDTNNGSISVNLNNTGVAPYSFNWIGLPDVLNIVEDLSIGTYSVSVTDANECVLLISNMDVKNCEDTENCYRATPVITPNGDNRNDFFVVNCVRDFAADLTVFDRWGRVVYTQQAYDNTWAGTDRNNNNLSEGAYMWVLEINFGQGRREIYKGTVTILR